uniref:Serine/threonine-protein phosphatase n=1 Tax=Romanomermis culicivorax TaxID=13658 RepID=A0A915JJ42_ROMCU
MTYQVNRDRMNLIFNALLSHARDQTRRPNLNFPLKSELIDELIDAAIFTFMSEPILLEVAPPIAIFGDIHGQFDDLVGWFDLIDWPPNRRCLFLGNFQSVPSPQYRLSKFLGDYVDRGDYSLEVATFMMVLKVLYPKDIYLLRGNHEGVAHDHATIINKSYGFLEECKSRLSGDQNRYYRRFNHAFACMPMAAIVGDQIFCMHGGLSPALMSMEQIKRVRRPVDIIDYGLLCDLCWSDPDPNLREKFAESLRGAGHRFSRDVVKEFCAKMNLTFIARAHQVPESENGFEFTFGSYKDRIMTIFSAPAYMRRMNEGACMLVDEKMKCNFKVLKPRTHDRAHG